MSRSTGSVSTDQIINDTNAVQIQSVDVSANPPLDTQVLAYNLANTRWEPTAAGGGGANATQLQGVNISATLPTNSQVLTYNSGALQWEPAASSGAVYSDTTVDLYISQATGNDANDGLSSGQAVQTWTRLLEIGSGYNVDQINIHLVQSESYTNLATLMDGITYTEQAPGAGTSVFQYIWDFRPLGATTVRVVTDMTGLQTNTPASATDYTPVFNTFKYYTHAAITTGINRWTYDATNDIYNASDINQNTATTTYLINTTAPLVAIEYYDDTDLALCGFSVETVFMAPNKSLIFERVSFQDGSIFKQFGNFQFKGCYVDGGSFMGGSQIEFIGCRQDDFQAVGGNLTYTNCYVDGTSNLYTANLTGYQSYLNFYPANKSFCVINACDMTSTLQATLQSEIYATNVGCSTVNCSGLSKITLSGGRTTTGVQATSNSEVWVQGLSTASTIYLYATENSTINAISCTIKAATSVVAIRCYNSSNIVLTTCLLDDSAGSGFSRVFDINNNSVVNWISSSLSTTSGRTGPRIVVANWSKLILPTITVSTSITSECVNVDQGSEIIVNGTLFMDTTSYLIWLQGGSTWRSTTDPINGTGTGLRRGTTAAGAFAFDTTGYTGVATDEMTLVIRL